MERVEDHIGLATSVARRYVRRNVPTEDTEEYAEALMAIHKAAEDYDPDNEAGATFATYASMLARWAICNLYTKRREFEESMSQMDMNRYGVPVGPQTDTMWEEEEENEHEVAAAEMAIVKDHLSVLTDDHRRVMELLLEGKSGTEIGKELGVSRQRVSVIRNAAIRELQVSIFGV